MRFHSTKSPGQFTDLKEAVLRSLPADNGLYMPENLPPLPASFWQTWRDLPLPELANQVISHFFQNAIPQDELTPLVHDAINFPAPVVKTSAGIHILELFHGPTLAFKDFGARFMARLMAHLTRDDHQLLTILVATSGDTGGAVASAFHQVPGTRVVILYPSGKVSHLQEKQLTTLGHNITALEIDGDFDDCQRLVKTAFLDRELSRDLNLTSANSINISRLVPQSIYYFEAARQQEKEPIFVVPSGNFGNLTAGLFAQKMGLPVKQFIAATNANDVVPRYLSNGQYEPRPTVATLSNAMDVGAPSNFARMENIFGNDWQEMAKTISAFSHTDEETRATIRRVHQETDYLLDPHGAVGWLAAEAWKKENPSDEPIVLETAHPAKFLDTVEAEIGKINIPQRLAILADQEKSATQLGTNAEGFLTWLKTNLT